MIAYYIVAGLVAAISLAAGLPKLLTGTKVTEDKMKVLTGRSDGVIRTLGALEVAAAFGLILPVALDILPWLAIAAAAGTVIVQVLAIRDHRKRDEVFVPNIVIGTLAATAGVLAAITVL